jgi:hypothetical protein
MRIVLRSGRMVDLARNATKALDCEEEEVR